MAVITAERLSSTVGAEVIGVDVDRLLNDETLPAWTLEVLETHGALVFRGLHLDDATQVAFSKKLGRVEVFGRGEHPEIFRVTLDPTKNPVAEYLKGTFDWHIDGCTDDVPIMATILSARAVAASGGETEFASTYGAFDALSAAEQARCLSLRVVHSLEAAQRLRNNNPSPEELALWRCRPPRSTPWSGPTNRGAAHWSWGPPPPTSWAWTPAKVGPSWTISWPGPPHPNGCTNTIGMSATW